MTTVGSPTRGNVITECPACFLPVANQGNHRRACIPADPADRGLVLRAGCHAATWRYLAPDARFRNRVSNLDVARLMLLLDRGVEVCRGGNVGWTIPTGSPLGGHLTRVAEEALRTGLAYPDGLLKAAPVHARHATYSSRPACEERLALRHRILGGQEIDLVDCEVCLDLPLSAVSYSNDE